MSRSPRPQADRRRELVDEVSRLARIAIAGTASETFRTCGNAGCRCHGAGPKHGPHMYVNYKGEDGRTTGYYVPTALHERVSGGLAAWREFQELAKEVALLNQAILDAERPKKATRRRRS